jgi:hypothetical protein
MIRVAVLVAALALPAVCRADQVWRWEDSAGRLHYSNVAARVPPHAEPLRGTIGTVRMQPLARTTPVQRTHSLPVTDPSLRAPHRAHAWNAAGGCGFGYSFGLALNAADASELVRQTSVLDALGVRWRKGCGE